MKLLALQGKNGKFFVNPEQVQQVYNGDKGSSIIRFANGDTAYVEGVVESVAQSIQGAMKVSGPRVRRT